MEEETKKKIEELLKSDPDMIIVIAGINKGEAKCMGIFISEGFQSDLYQYIGEYMDRVPEDVFRSFAAAVTRRAEKHLGAKKLADLKDAYTKWKDSRKDGEEKTS